MNSEVIFFAFRYAISYGNDAPGLVEYIKEHWDKLEKRDRKLINKEITENLTPDSGDVELRVAVEKTFSISSKTKKLVLKELDDKVRKDVSEWWKLTYLSTDKEQVKEKIPDNDDVVYWGFQYCLGRMTYVTSMMSEYLVRAWEDISKVTQDKIIADIKASDERGGLGWDCDKKSWINVVDSSKIKNGHILANGYCPKCFPDGSDSEGFEHTVARFWDGKKTWCTKCEVADE